MTGSTPPDADGSAIEGALALWSAARVGDSLPSLKAILASRSGALPPFTSLVRVMLDSNGAIDFVYEVQSPHHQKAGGGDLTGVPFQQMPQSMQFERRPILAALYEARFTRAPVRRRMVLRRDPEGLLNRGSALILPLADDGREVTHLLLVGQLDLPPSSA